MAGRSLGELVRKMGDRVLVHIIPILQQARSSLPLRGHWHASPKSCSEYDTHEAMLRRA